MAGEDDGSLLYTSTWAIAAVCALFIAVSLLAERLIHFVGKALLRHKKPALHEALEKLKDELMLVGFISLALTAGQEEIVKICVPEKWARAMLQCPRPDTPGRRLATDPVVECPKGKSPFITVTGLHQLHILLFILAAVHIAYSVTIMALGTWKVHHWKAWEERASTKENISHHDIRYTRQTTFVRTHANGPWYRYPLLLYVVAFLNQFFHALDESDYHTLRHGFIKRHMPRNIDFNFHRYILRSLEDDFKHVVGISFALWAYVVVLMLINVNGWESHLWISFIPITLVLIVGTKLQLIITKMSGRIVERHVIVEGMPDVVPQDEYFWFSRPRLVLHILHFILFQNSIEITYNIWLALTFPYQTCINENRILLICRLIIGVVSQIICAYTTLPMYALLVQMGSHIKSSIFNEHIQTALVSWHETAKRNVKESVRRREFEPILVDVEEGGFYRAGSAGTEQSEDMARTSGSAEDGGEEIEEYVQPSVPPRESGPKNH